MVDLEVDAVKDDADTGATSTVDAAVGDMDAAVGDMDAVPGDSFVVYRAGADNLDSPVFVLIHGGGLSALSWGACVARCKDRLHLVAVDMRGHGMQ